MKIDAHKSFGQRECPACACEVPANTNRCPVCGYEFPTATAVQRFTRIGGALIMLALLLWLLAAALH